MELLRILHTADWHLGKIVNGVHMTEEQEFILNKLIEVMRQTQPDILIIAGDLYDRAVPPKEAVQLLNKTLTYIYREFNIPVLIAGGNHDSPDRLDFASDLLREQNLIIRAKYEINSEPIIIYDEYGPVHFHIVPYLEPEEVRDAFEDKEIKSHQHAMEAIIGNIKARFDLEKRHVFIGHAFLQGGMESESEERLSMIGGTPYVNAELFTDFIYTAMGHLHQAQRVGADYIRYSGSIYKYSFSEVNHDKSVTVIDLNDTEMTNYELISLVPRHDLRVLKGYFADLLESPQHPTEDYLHVILLDDGQIIDPMNKLRQVYPNVLRLEREVSRKADSLADLSTIRQKREKSHEELFSHFYYEMKNKEIDPERKAIFNSIVHELTQEKRGE